MTTAANLLQEDGKFAQAAKVYRDNAEIYEKDTEWKQAAQLYEKASDIFNTEDNQVYANSSAIKAAECWAFEGDYGRAAMWFMSTIEKQLNSPKANMATRWLTRDYMLNAGKYT
jgi:hypothetical protein